MLIIAPEPFKFSFLDLDCHHEANFSAVAVSSSLNSTYGKENINGVSNKPWVGGSVSSPIWVSVDFPNPIYLKNIKVTGGKVDLFSNNTLVTCHIDIFLLQYKTSKTGPWVRKGVCIVYYSYGSIMFSK